MPSPRRIRGRSREPTSTPRGTIAFARACPSYENPGDITEQLIARQTRREFEALFPVRALQLAEVRFEDDYEHLAEATIRRCRAELGVRFHREFAALNAGSLRQYQLRYVFARLTHHIDERAYGPRSFAPYLEGHRVHIEHILPQTATDQVR
jgi:hypothetical protein